jgi:hypothetical protein
MARQLLPALLLLALLCAIAFVVHRRFVQPALDQETFATSLPTFAAVGRDAARPEATAAKLPRRRGRVLVLDLTGPVPAIHPAWHQLAPTLRARSPDQVGTVVQIVEPRSGAHSMYVYAWPERTLLGTWLFERHPGLREVQTGAQTAGLDDAADPTVVRKLIEWLPSTQNAGPSG